jgi:hypothetical protein
MGKGWRLAIYVGSAAMSDGAIGREDGKWQEKSKTALTDAHAAILPRIFTGRQESSASSAVLGNPIPF